MNLLNNKVTIITGAAQGIGKAIATRFSEENAIVVIIDINVEKAAVTAKELADRYGGKCVALGADVTNENDIRNAVDEVVKQFGKIDILVNNAGVQPPKKMFWDITGEDWDFALNIDLKSVFLFSKIITPLFMEQNFGCIVNTASVAGLYLWEGSAHYIVAKAGIIELTKVMAFELLKHNIRVNAVAPGHVETELNRQMLSKPGARAKSEGQVPLGKLAQPEDLAGAYVYLASDKAKAITGHTVYVDGGLTQIK